MTPVETLAARQLEAYNRADLDAFCACFHDDVRVLDGDGLEVVRGIAAFRERYRAKFERGGFGATVDVRLAVGVHAIDDETWWAVDPDTAERHQGRVLVRYRERDGRLAEVQFLR